MVICLNPYYFLNTRIIPIVRAAGNIRVECYGVVTDFIIHEMAVQLDYTISAYQLLAQGQTSWHIVSNVKWRSD